MWCKEVAHDSLAYSCPVFLTQFTEGNVFSSLYILAYTVIDFLIIHISVSWFESVFFLSCKSTFCILNTSPLSHMCFANIFSQSGLLYNFSIVLFFFFFEKQGLLILKSHYQFFFLWLMLCVFYLKNLCLIQSHRDFLFFNLEIWQFLL